MNELIVIAGKLVVAADQDGSVDVVDDGAVLVSNGAVAAVGSARELRAEHPYVPTFGGPGFVALPGLVDSHHHVGLTPTQLGVPSESLELWTLMLMQCAPVDPYLDTLVSGLELLRSGVTTVQHLASVRDDPAGPADADDAVLRAYADLGMRVSYSVGIVDQNRLLLDGEQSIVADLPAPYNQELAAWLTGRASAAEQLARGYHELRKRWDGEAGGRIRIQLAPTNLHWCSDEALQLVTAASEADGVPMHMHLLETAYQRVYGLRRSKRGTLGHLDDLGVLGPRLTIGHGVHVDDSDLDLLAERGVSLCHNPSSNLRLKSGTAPLNRYLARGIPVALGIDEAGLADDRDMLLEIKLAYNVHRAPGIDTRVPTTGEVLAMATGNGARTTPFGNAVGNLRPGARADLVLVDAHRLAGAHLSERVPVADAIVHRAKPEHVHTVLVDGEVVVENGRVRTVSEEDVFGEIAERMAGPWPGREDAERRSRMLVEAARRHYASWLG
ncbi:amidohydrolase family protein [Amycolatopsis sp. GM8]|uniref:amidohydrolase family protein n=1 Tax=Amycolatopsis sp. GM8 TaxID=2896530 RepID=UPI001F465121|nr:amidohydrolase family protein [Amycolatopsis sp. GM8]